MTTPVLERGPAAAAGAAGADTARLLHRSQLAAGPVLVLAGWLSGNATAVLLGLVLATSVALVPRVRAGLALPAAVCALVGAAASAGVLAAALAVDLLAHPSMTAAALLLLASAAAWSGRRRPPAGGRPDRWWLLGRGPAVIACAIGCLQALDVDLVAPWALLSTDIAEHAAILGQVRSAGMLDYAASAYPRGLHMLLALSAAVDPAPSGTAAAVLAQLQLTAASVWLCLAALLWTAASAAEAWADRLGGGHRATRLSGAAAGWVLLSSSSFQMSFVHMGSSPAMLAVLVLWLLPLVCLRGPRPSPALLVSGSLLAVVLLSQLWQPLALAPVVALGAVLAHPVMRAATWTAVRRRPRTAAAVAAATTGAALVLLPTIAGLLRAGGLSLAAIPGATPGPPWLATLAALASVLAVLTSRGDRSGSLLWTGTTLGLLGVVAVLLYGAGGGWDLQQYYPRKGLWLLTVFAAPLVAAAVVVTGSRGAVWSWRRLAAFPSVTVLARAGLVACAVVAAVAVVVPGLVHPLAPARTALPGPHADQSGARRLSVLTSFGDRRETVVPIAVALTSRGTQSGPYVVSKLLSARTGQAQNHGAPETVCLDVARVAGTGPALVVTDLPVAELRPYLLRGGCPTVPVVTHPGGDQRMVDEMVERLRQERRD